MNELIENIRTALLKKKPSYQTTNRREVRVRCPYCGDSTKDLSSAHLYIEMMPPFRFHCFKCETAGVLTQKTLHDLSVFDNSTAINILEANKESRENLPLAKVKTIKNKKLLNIPDLNSFETINSVAYFNGRFETNLSAEYIQQKFKAILNPSKFLLDNNIFIPAGINFDYTKTIGFHSMNNSHVVFRDISGQQGKRYNNLNLYQQNNINTASKIYTINSELNVMRKKVNLVMTEGIFDIIGVYLAFYKDTDAENDTIFAAACGKGYNAVISNIIRMGFLDLDITIYSDSDVNPIFFKSMKENTYYLKNSKITLYYNSKEKDFGIPKNRILLRKTIL